MQEQQSGSTQWEAEACVTDQQAILLKIRN